MKNLKYFGVAAIVISLLIIPSCNNAGAETASAKTNSKSAEGYIEIPGLLARSGKVGSDMEANKMFNTYESIKAQIRNNPRDYAARLKMADLYIVEARATGNYGYYYPAAVSMIDGVLAENPKNKDDKFRALTSKAVILLSYHKFEEAREVGEQAMSINPHNSRVYGILTDANVEMGDYEKAVVMADSMVAIRPDLRSYSRVSYLREIYGDIEGAKEAMEMAIKAGAPGHEETTWSQVTLGNIHENYGELDKASMHYEAALASRKGYPFALKGLASVEAKRGNFEKAISLLEEAVDNRKEASFYETLAMIYQEMGRMDDMNRARKKTLAALQGLSGDKSHIHSHKDGDGHKHPDAASHGHSHEVGLEMAWFYLELTDNYDEALHHALHEYAIRPDNIEVNRALAYAYLKTDKIKQAREHFEKASVTNSMDPQLILIGGLIEMEQGNVERGKSILKEAFRVNPHQMGGIADDARGRLQNKAVVASS